MRSKMVPLIICLALVLLLVGGSRLYGKLSTGYEPPKVVEATEAVETGEEDVENDAPEENSEENSSVDENGEAESEAPKTIPAPDFTMLNEAGEEVSLSDFFGKPVVLNFWATWCGPCQNEMPHFDEAYQNYGEKINFLMLNITDGQMDTVESAKECIEEGGYTFPIYFDTTLSGGNTYGVSSIPMTFFIDPQGNLMTYYLGSMPRDVLMGQLEKMVEK